MLFFDNMDGLTENYWPLYGVAGISGAFLGWTWLLFLGSRAKQMMNFSVHILTTYLAVVTYLCVMFLGEAVFLWCYGCHRCCLAVLCNVVHVTVSGIVFHVLIHGGREATSMPPKSLSNSLRCAVSTSFGSICYGSLFTAAIRTLRWEIRGLRSKIGRNECLLCCVDFLFHLVEFLVRWFNKYAYVQIAVHGKSFNHSAKDAWELFQSTGVEALIAYDCSGAVLLMGTILGGLISGTCAAIWTRVHHPELVMMVGSTAMLMGMILVGLAMVVVESAVTSIYICYAEDPALINRWDASFFTQISEKLHQRLQHRSSRVREVYNHRIDDRV